MESRNSEDVIEATGVWLKELDEGDPDFLHHLLEGLWVHQAQHVVDADLLKRLLSCDDHRARAAAVRVLSFWTDELQNPLELIRARIDDSHPRVRLEAVRSLTFLPPEEDVIEVALGVLEYDVDDYLQYTLDEAMRFFEQ